MTRTKVIHLCDCRREGEHGPYCGAEGTRAMRDLTILPARVTCAACEEEYGKDGRTV